MAGSSRSIAAALALGFLVLHLPYPARSLEDLDSINFALGIRDFDVAEHQPHPPGYPLFILTAKAVNAMVGSEVTTLSLLGIVCGALSALVLVALFGVLDKSGHRRSIAWGSALLALTAPLMWITAARPLSDVPGLAAALLAQWLLLRAATTRELAAAAFAAGVGAGIRSQVVWLTVPLILLAVARHRQAWRPRAALAIAAAYGGGVLLWALPLLALSGGPRVYWNAVAFQGGADLSGVTMLWTTPTPRQFLAQIEYGFLAPWGWWPLAGVLLAMATVGIVRLMATAPDTLVTLAAAFGPYLVFNMLFQETVTTRYSLPLVVPIAYLATAGVSWIVPRHAPWLVAGLAAVALSVGQGSLVAQAGSPAPAFRMLADMRALTAVLPEREAPVLAMHRRQDFDLRRPLRWIEPESPTFASRLPAPPRVEWLELVKYLERRGARAGLVCRRSAPERSRARRSRRTEGIVPVAAQISRVDRWSAPERDGLVRAGTTSLVPR